MDKIILHPNFRYMLTQPDRYDIALLKLDHPVYYRYPHDWIVHDQSMKRKSQFKIFFESQLMMS